MNNAPVKLRIEKHLTILYKLWHHLGLINFKFNSAGKVEVSQRLSIVSSTLLAILVTVNGILLFLGFFVALGYYIRNRNFEIHLTSIEAQDKSFTLLNWYHIIMSGFVHSQHLMRNRGTAIANINEMLSIFKGIGRATDRTLYINAAFQPFMGMKFYLTAAFTCIKITMAVPTFFGYFDFVTPYAYIMYALTILTHIYSQLVLTCFFMKMNERLTSLGSQRTGAPESEKVITDFVKIYFRIHRVKRSLNKFFTPSFLINYVGSTVQIAALYEILKTLFYGKETSKTSFQADLIFQAIIFLSLWFDIYLVCRLSDMLAKEEDAFGRRLLNVVVNEIPAHEVHVQRQLDLVLFQPRIYGFSTMAFQQIKIDQAFSFECLMNITCALAITCLQYYAGEEYYAPHHAEDSFPTNTTQFM